MTQKQEIHPYYVDKAKDALRRAHCNPDNAHALAEWASNWAEAERNSRSANTNHTVAGVLITKDSTIIGEYIRQHSNALGTTFYVSKQTQEKYNLPVEVLDMSLPLIGREIGEKVIAISGHDVATGARTGHPRK